MPAHRARLTYNDVAATLPTLAPEEQVNLLELLSALLKKAVTSKTTPRSLMELEGLGSEIWAGLSADEYVARERDSWN
jgi:hypothetical protein